MSYPHTKSTKTKLDLNQKKKLRNASLNYPIIDWKCSLIDNKADEHFNLELIKKNPFLSLKYYYKLMWCKISKITSTRSAYDHITLKTPCSSCLITTVNQRRAELVLGRGEPFGNTQCRKLFPFFFIFIFVISIFQFKSIKTNLKAKKTSKLRKTIRKNLDQSGSNHHYSVHDPNSILIIDRTQNKKYSTLTFNIWHLTLHSKKICQQTTIFSF